MSVGGIPLFQTCIVSLLLFLVLWFIMSIVRVLLPTLSFGWFMLGATTLCCLAQLKFGLLIGSVFLLLLLLLRMSVLGPTHFVILVKWVTFPGTLRWPAAVADLGLGGVSHVETLLLFELWAGERLVLERALPRYRRPGRPISVSTVPFGPGIVFFGGHVDSQGL